MTPVIRCPVCDLKTLWVLGKEGRDQALAIALDMGAKHRDGVKDLLCKGHQERWEELIVSGLNLLRAANEAEEEVRKGTEKP